MKQQNNRQTQQQQPMTNFAGYGPQGWTRGDQFIEDDICSRLYTDRALDATGIQVEVSGGNVQLRGYVPTLRSKTTAAAIAQSVTGVKNLDNHLEIAVAATMAAPQTTGAGGGRTRS